MHYWGRQWPCCDNCVVKMLLTRKTEKWSRSKPLAKVDIRSDNCLFCLVLCLTLDLHGSNDLPINGDMMSRHLARVINDLFSFAFETVFSAKQAVTHVQMSRPQTIFLCLNQLRTKCALSNSWSIKRQSRSRLAQFRHLKEAWTITLPSLSV